MWSRKIAQFAIPRNRSSRRSRPFSGRVALIFMGTRSDAFDARVEQNVAGRPDVSQRGNNIVTAQHSDYTGREGVTSKTGITDQLERCPRSWTFPPRASISHFAGNTAIHDRPHF